MHTFEKLQPQEVFKHFAAISAIPRGSQNEKHISDYLVAFARARGLEAFQDNMFNVLVRKPGSPGYEDAPGLILHGHMDMVCEKDEGVNHDFTKDGIRLVVDGDFVRADGTSLGADNGIGISFILALLDSKDIPHPPLEAVMTVMEEMGKAGAANFDVAKLSSRRMVDFNWVTDKQILAGCAGDISCTIDVPAQWEQPPENSVALLVKAGGLLGGHCEFDIHLERASGIILLARIFNALARKLDVQIASFNGGAQNNVIPAHAELGIVLNKADMQEALEIIKAMEGILQSEFAIADPGLKIAVENTSRPQQVFSGAASRRLARIIVLLPNGVVSMSRQISGLVESSSNLGTIRPTDHGAILTCTITAGVATRKHDIFDRMKELVDLAGRDVVFKQFGLDAPEFPPTPNSVSVSAAVEAYRSVHREDPEVLVSSCSLELGFFVNRIPGLDTVGIGTELHNLHSTLEKVNHKSVARSWRVIQEFVRRMRN